MNTNTNWEERFDKEFVNNKGRGFEQSAWGDEYRGIKSFITSLLAEEREKAVLKGSRNRIIHEIREGERKRLVAEVEKIMEKMKEDDTYAKGYNDGIDAVKDLLNQKEP